MARYFTRDIFAAKININQNIFNYDYEKLIPLIGNALLNSKAKKIETKNLIWTFTDVEKILIENEEFIIGKLCKARKNVMLKKLDDDKCETYLDKENNLAYESTFLLSINEEILIFEESSAIPKDKFIERFEKLCYRSDNTLGEIKIELYPQANLIDQYLQRLNEVYYAKFKIVPANFKADSGFEKLDQLLKENRVREADIVLRNSDGKISRTQDSLFSQCLKMIKGAYGKFLIKGKDIYKKNQKIDSEYTIYKKSIPYNDNMHDYVKTFYSLYQQVKSDRSNK